MVQCTIKVLMYHKSSIHVYYMYLIKVLFMHNQFLHNSLYLKDVAIDCGYIDGGGLVRSLF